MNELLKNLGNRTPYRCYHFGCTGNYRRIVKYYSSYRFRSHYSGLYRSYRYKQETRIITHLQIKKSAP